MDEIDREIAAGLRTHARRRAAQSGSALIIYALAVAYSESLLVAVVGGVVILTARTWVLERYLLGAWTETTARQKRAVAVARETRASEGDT